MFDSGVEEADTETVLDDGDNVAVNSTPKLIVEGFITCVVAGIVDCAAVETDVGIALGWAATAFMMSAAFICVRLILRY